MPFCDKGLLITADIYSPSNAGDCKYINSESNTKVPYCENGKSFDLEGDLVYRAGAPEEIGTSAMDTPADESGN